MSGITWHTEGRRHPDLIGKDVSGRRIPGGPYMIWQVAGLALIPLLWSTRGIWGTNVPGLAQLVVIASATAAAVWLLGRINFANRSPLSILVLATPGMLGGITHPRGRLRGRTIPRAPKPKRHPAPARHTNTTPAHVQPFGSVGHSATGTAEPVTGEMADDRAPGRGAEPSDKVIPEGNPNEHVEADLVATELAVASAATDEDEEPTVVRSPLEEFLAAAGSTGGKS